MNNRMKRFLTGCLLISASLFVHAKSGHLGNGQVTFVGSITNATCNFSIKENNASSSSPNLSSVPINRSQESLKKSTLFNIAGSNVNGKPCLTSKKQSLRISWMSSVGTWEESGLKHRGSSTGLAIQLMDKNNFAFNRSRMELSYTNSDIEVNGGIPIKAKLIEVGPDTEGSVKGAVSLKVSYF